MLLLCFPSYGNTKDSIDFAIFTEQAETFVTVVNKGTKLLRWQNYTGNVLTRYDVPAKPLLAIHENPISRTLVGLSKDELLVWNINSSEIVQRFNVPIKGFNYVFYRSEGDISDYLPEKNLLTFVSGNELNVVDASNGELLFTKTFDNQLYSPRFLADGDKLIVVERISYLEQKLTEIDILNQKTKSLVSNNSSIKIAVRNDRTQYSTLVDNSVISYNLQHRETVRVAVKNLYNHFATMCYVTPDIVAISNVSSVFYVAIADTSSVNIYLGSDYVYDGFDSNTNLLLFSKESKVFVKNIIGETLFESELSDTDFMCQNTVLNVNDVNNLYDKEQYKITTLLATGDRYYATTNTGALKVHDQNKVMLGSESILGTAITHFNLLDDELAFIAGYGRGSLFHIKKKEHIRVLNGHNANIIGSEKLSDRFLVTLAQDKKAAIWDMDNGAYIGDFKLEKMPFRLFATKENKATITFTDGSQQVLDLQQIIDEYLNPVREILLSTTHSTGIQDIDFLPESDLMLSTDGNGYLKVWDTKSIAPIFTKKMEGSSIIRAVFNLEFNEIIVYGMHTIYHVDYTTGNVKREVSVPPLYNNDFALHKMSAYPTSSLFAINNNRSRNQYAYHAGSGLFYSLLSAEGRYAPLGLASDEQTGRLAFFTSDYIDIWSVKDGIQQEKRIVNPNQSWQNGYADRKIAFSPDGNKMLFEQEEDLIVYDLLEDQEVFRANHVFAATFIGDNAIAYCHRNGDSYTADVKVGKYDLEHKDTLFYVDSPSGRAAFHLQYNSSDNVLAMGYNNGDMVLLDATVGIELKRITKKNVTPNVAYNPANGHITTTVPGTTMVLDWKKLRFVKAVPYRGDGTVTPRYVHSPDGTYYAQLYWNHVEFFEGHSYKKLFEFPLVDSTSLRQNIAISQDNRYLTFMDPFEGEVHIYDIAQKELRYRITPEEGGRIDSYQLLRDDDDEYVVALVKKEKPKEEQPPPDAPVGSRFYNTYFTVYNLRNNNEKMQEVLLGDNNNLEGISLTRDNNYWFLRSDWREVIVVDNKNNKSSKYTIDIDNSWDKLYPSIDYTQFIVTDTKGYLYVIDIKTGVIQHSMRISQSKIKDVVFFEEDDVKYMITSSEDGFARIWDYETKKLKTALLAFSQDDYMFMNSDGYYSGTRGIIEAVNFKEKGKIYGFEQFDLIYNRPDLVLSNLNNDLEVQKIYYAAYEKRLKKLGYTPGRIDVKDGSMSVPAISIHRSNLTSQTKDRYLNFSVSANDAQYAIKKLHVWVNGVPIYGVQGLDIGKFDRSINQTVSLELSAGLNVVKASVANEKGIESLKESFYITYIGDHPIPKTYYVGIGVSNYKNQRYNLTYATKDVKDLEEMFSDRYPDFTGYHLLDSAVTKDNILALKEALSKTNVDDMVIISFSGHGVLDKEYNWYYATYDMDFEQPSGYGLRYEEIESLLDNIPARKKILLIDACHSGEVDKEYLTKETVSSTALAAITSLPVGGRGAEAIDLNPTVGLENSFELMNELFANLSKGNGAVAVSAAGGTEYAFEGEQWNNGVFTYSFINGLKYGKADSNKDGKITVNELKNYVSQEVEKLTEGRQKPTSRQENIENDFSL
ncbi:caspase family protein [Sphingobacterium micropteri]|nr:caspase family protein [Sphingobacterium micropteri]